MVGAHDRGGQHREQAERTAHSLIAHDDLPLLIRCRALCILGCSDEGDFIRYAKEAVHFAEVGVRETQQEIGEFGENVEAEDDVAKPDMKTAELILKCCREVLEGAEAAFAENPALEADEMEGQEDDEDDEDGELVWDPDWDEETQARVKATWAPWPPQLTTTPTDIQTSTTSQQPTSDT